MAELISAGDFVGRGERKAAESLKRLPPSWTVICNKSLVSGESTREVDFIIVGDHCVFVVEEKSWSGHIRGDDNGWFLDSGESFPSPINTAEGLARRLRGYLEGRVPGGRSSFPHRFVLARVLLTSEDATLLVKDPRAKSQVFGIEECRSALLSADRELAEYPLGSNRVRFVRELTQLKDRPKVPREISSYRVLEVMSSKPRVRTFRARHEDGFERILKVIEREGSAAGDDESQVGRALRREYQALQRLGESGRAPRVDPSFRWDQDQYLVIPIHPLQGTSLRASRGQESPGSERVWQILESSLAALSDVHNERVVHRALTPDSVHILDDGSVVFSDFALARIQGEQTIASVVSSFDYEHSFLPPESRTDLRFASAASDVYSLVFSLLSWITGRESEDPEELLLSLEEVTSLDSETIESLSEILADCFLDDPAKRPSAEELLARVQESRPSSPESDFQAQGGQLQPGAIVEDQYEIIRSLGQGGTGRSYLARDFRADMYCVLKAIDNPELVTELARTEFATLRDLHHPNIQRVFDVRAPGSPFHLKLEYVEGKALSDLVEEHRGDVAFCRRVGRQVLQALSYLAEHDVVHRDVSPGNIIVPGNPTQPVRLIDFSLAAKAYEGRGLVGTVRYRAPEVDAGTPAGPTADLYSLGVVLFELLAGRMPYEVGEDGRLFKDRPATLDTIDEELLGALLDPLLQATAPDEDSRFETAEEFSEALGIALLPYAAWKPRTLPELDIADAEDVVPGLVEIVEAEGPMLCIRAYRLYAESQGQQWQTHSRLLNRAMFAAIRQGVVEESDECGTSGQRYKTVRMPGSPEVVVRERGDRRVDEIPWGEMAELMRFIIAEESLDVTSSEDQDLLFYELEDSYQFDQEDYGAVEKMEAVLNRYFLGGDSG